MIKRRIKHILYTDVLYEPIEIASFISAITSFIGFVALVIYIEITQHTLVLSIAFTREIVTLTNLNALCFILTVLCAIIFTVFHISDLFEYMHKLFFIGAFLSVIGFITTAYLL